MITPPSGVAPAQPPPTLKLEASYRDAWSAALAGIFMVGLACFAAWMFAGPQETLFALLIIGGIWGVILSFFVVASWRRIQRERRDALQLFEEPALAQWQYGVEEWRALSERRYEAERHTPGWMWIVGLIPALMVGGIFFVISSQPLAPTDPAVNGRLQATIFAIGVIITAFIMVLTFAGIIGKQVGAARKYAQAQTVLTPYVRFGTHGLYHEADGYAKLEPLVKVSVLTPTTMVNYLKRMFGDSEILVFSVWVRARGQTYDASMPVPKYVAIPEAHQREAEALIAAYAPYLDRKRR